LKKLRDEKFDVGWQQEEISPLKEQLLEVSKNIPTTINRKLYEKSLFMTEQLFSSPPRDPVLLFLTCWNRFIEEGPSKIPSYEDAVRIENGRKILKALAECGGVANFSEIGRRSGVKDPVLAYHLDRLQSLNVVEREVKGTYRLTYKTPLCYIFETAETSIAYLGLLGRRESRSEPETSVALKLLTKEGISPELVYVVTSPEALGEWKELKPPYQWILCYEDQIINIDAIKDRVTPQLESLLRDYIVIIDCTSATKPATIAYYELAQTYRAPLIYVYEETKQLKWLISKDHIRQKLGIGKYSSAQKQSG